MLCAKCQKEEATVHLTTVVDGENVETINLCKDCAPGITGMRSLDPKELEELSVIGKKCEFCGREAFSGQTTASGRAIYWCVDFGQEFGRIVMELTISERPELFQQNKGGSSLLSLFCDPDLRAWSEAANRKAMQTLKERRQQDGRDKGS